MRNSFVFQVIFKKIGAFIIYSSYHAILIVLIFVANNLSAQSEFNMDWIKQLTTYRSVLLRENPKALNQVKLLIERWDDEKVNDNEKWDVFINIVASNRGFEEIDSEILRDKIHQHCTNDVLRLITNDELQSIFTNSELLDLIFLGLLDNKYPFKINPKSNLFEELVYYKIAKDEVVAEIGAGSGGFGIILAMLFSDIDLYLNDIKKEYLAYIYDKLERRNIYLGASNIKIVLGSKRSSHFGKGIIDKIIVRNTFHHFNKADKMLKSIRRSLKPNGELFIYEKTIEEDSDHSYCTKSMFKQDIINRIELNGFSLLHDQKIGKWSMLKFKTLKN